MEARLVACAQLVSIDQRTNSLSLFNLIEEINLPAFPFAFPYMTVAVLLLREANEPSAPANLSLRLFMGDQQVFSRDLTANFQQHLRMRLVVDIQAIVFQTPGIMRVTVNQDDRELGAWKIYVNNIGPGAAVVQVPPS
jgi:hypothetical protein